MNKWYRGKWTEEREPRIWKFEQILLSLARALSCQASSLETLMVYRQHSAKGITYATCQRIDLGTLTALKCLKISDEFIARTVLAFRGITQTWATLPRSLQRLQIMYDEDIGYSHWIHRDFGQLVDIARHKKDRYPDLDTVLLQTSGQNPINSDDAWASWSNGAIHNVVREFENARIFIGIGWYRRVEEMGEDITVMSIKDSLLDI